MATGLAGQVCLECGASAEHRHHVIPRSRGGTATVPLCHGCHERAHGRSIPRLPRRSAVVERERLSRDQERASAAVAEFKRRVHA